MQLALDLAIHLLIEVLEIQRRPEHGCLFGEELTREAEREKQSGRLLGRTVLQGLDELLVEQVVVAARRELAARGRRLQPYLRVELVHEPTGLQHRRPLLQPDREGWSGERLVGRQEGGVDGANDRGAPLHLPIPGHHVAERDQLRSFGGLHQIVLALAWVPLLEGLQVVLLNHHRHQLGVQPKHVQSLGQRRHLPAPKRQHLLASLEGVHHDLRVFGGLPARQRGGPEELRLVDDVPDVVAASLDDGLDGAQLHLLALRLHDVLDALGHHGVVRAFELDVVTNRGEVADAGVAAVVADAYDGVFRGLYHLLQGHRAALVSGRHAVALIHDDH
mmetsp:Transcript_55593/g.140939  ORF Transcript_55593/g.140939 Transcript_55593/m.140939 type:complete len:333 (+) Transcript_55593:575-1573(+)